MNAKTRKSWSDHLSRAFGLYCHFTELSYGSLKKAPAGLLKKGLIKIQPLLKEQPSEYHERVIAPLEVAVKEAI